MSHDGSKAEMRRKRDKIIIFTVNILIVKRDRDRGHRDYRRVTNFPQRLYLNERLCSYSLK